jgi:hypothetical protein
VAQQASLRAEVGAFLCSRVLTHAFGTVVGEGEHPWHHFGSSVVGVEELQIKSKTVRLDCGAGKRKKDKEKRHKLKEYLGTFPKNQALCISGWHGKYHIHLPFLSSFLFIFWQYWGLNSGPHACQTLCHLSHISSPFYFSYFSSRIFYFCQAGLDHDRPI